MVVETVFAVILLAEIVTLVAVVISIVNPQRRIWPPPKENSWGKYLMSGLFFVIAVGTIVLGILDWSSFNFPKWIRITGVPVWVAGHLLAIWAIISLGMASTYGNEGKLIHVGPYKLSRNPQYLGFITSLIGWGLMVNSLYTLVVCLVAIIPLLLVPLAEEPWLRLKYDKEYAAYFETTSRFLTLPGKKQ